MDACTKLRVKVTEHKSAKLVSAKREMLFQNLASLQCPFQELGRKSSISIHKHMLDKPNKLGLIALCYFLFCKLDEKRSRELFKHLYPPYDRKQELEFQKVCLSWWKECTKGNNEFKFPTVPSNLFMKAGADVIVFVFEFSTYVLYSCARRLCPHSDFVLLPLKSCQNFHIGAFQKVSLKGAISGAMSSFSRSVQLSREADFQTKAHADSMLTKYRDNSKRVKDLRRAKSILMEQLKNAHSHGGASKKDDLKKIESAISSDLNSVRKMWDLIISATDETGMDREIVQSVLSRNEESESLSAVKLGVKIPSLLIKDCNQEVSERVGPTLYQTEQLNLAGFIRLVNIMLQQILLKLHDGLPNFDSNVTVLKAQSIVHSRCSNDLAKLQQNFEVKIPQAKNMNIQCREKVDRCNHQWNLNNETLIPGLPCPNLPSMNTGCNLTDDLDIATCSPSDRSSDAVCGVKEPTPRIYSPGKVTVMPVLIPSTSSTVVGSSNQHISECNPATRDNDLAAINSELDMFDLFSSLKQGHLSFGPSSPLKENQTADNFGGKYAQPTLFQQLDFSDKLSSVHQPIVIDEAKPRKPALDKLVDRVVDFTLQETDGRPGATQFDVNLMDIEGFDLSRQLDPSLAFTSVDKVMRSPPQKPWSVTD